MRQYERFDDPTFAIYLKKVRRKLRKASVVTGNASQHRHKEVRKNLTETLDKDPVLAHRDAEAQRGRTRLEGCKIQAATSKHHETRGS